MSAMFDSSQVHHGLYIFKKFNLNFTSSMLCVMIMYATNMTQNVMKTSP